jgi:hypothetical protein
VTLLSWGAARVDPRKLSLDLAGSDVFGVEARRPQWRRVKAELRSRRNSELTTERTVTATLGKLYMDQGHVEEAESIFEQILAVDPDHPVALKALGSLRVARMPAVGQGAREIRRLERFLGRVSRPRPMVRQSDL